MGELTTWLASYGLERYAEAFVENDVDLDILPTLSDADLESLGMSLGHRRKLQRALAQIEATTVASTPTTPPAGTLETGAERRIVTVLFCDLVGSTSLSARLDPEDLRAVLATYQDVCAAEIQAEGGYLARYVGDGLLVYFGYPQAYEDDPDRATRAAMAMVAAVRGIDTGQDVSLQVRIGVATGAAVVGDIGEGERRESMAIVGETPNLAARLQALAAPDDIVVSESTRHLANAF